MNDEDHLPRDTGCDSASGKQVDMAPRAPAALVAAVQANCHVADARHAADLPLCIYLLQMREFYRWECGLGFGAALDHDAVGQWLAQREALWSDIADAPFQSLPFEGRRFDPWDANTLNDALMPRGLIYGAGRTAVDRPTFFLARLHSAGDGAGGLRLHVSDREYARGLSAPPAVLADGCTIVLRRESLARWLWEKFESFSLRRADGPFKALTDAYVLSDCASFVAGLPRLVDELSEALLLHELGEYRAGQWLDPGWSAMRQTLNQRRTELHVRAVRDHLADLEVTLPALLERRADKLLHFWFANYDGVRERLYPALKDAYDAWRGGDGGAGLRRAARSGVTHFRRLAEEVLRLHRHHGENACQPIDRLLVSPDAVCVPQGRWVA